jgi:hypothetical protein
MARVTDPLALFGARPSGARAGAADDAGGRGDPLPVRYTLPCLRRR